MSKNVFHCDSCKRNLVHSQKHTTGYGLDYDTKDKICFDCCGEQDRDAMAESKAGDKFMLYLSYEQTPHERLRPRPNRPCWILPDNGYVSNWPGTLKIKITQIKVGCHNIAYRRYDVWFKDHTGSMWWGVTYGDNTQICHCTKLKA